MKLIEINTPGHLDAFRSDDIISDYINEGRIYSRNDLWYYEETDEEVKDYLENAFYPYLGIQDQAEKELDESSWKSLNEVREVTDTITITGDDSEGSIAELLNYIKELGNTGHGFTIVVDPDNSEFRKEFYWDGDGSDWIKEIQSKKKEELNEDFKSTLKKVKQYTKKGLMTATILSSLLASPKYSDAQKEEIKQSYSSSKPSDNNTISYTDLGSAMLAYLDAFGQEISTMPKFNEDGKNGKEIVKQVMIRCQLIRDGEKPSSFPNFEEKAIWNTVKEIIYDKMNNFGVAELIQLIARGKKINVIENNNEKSSSKVERTKEDIAAAMIGTLKMYGSNIISNKKYNKNNAWDENTVKEVIEHCKNTIDGKPSPKFSGLEVPELFNLVLMSVKNSQDISKLVEKGRINEEFKIVPRKLNGRYANTDIEKLVSFYFDKLETDRKIEDICGELSEKIVELEKDFIKLLKILKKEEEFKKNRKAQQMFISKAYEMTSSVLEYHLSLYWEEPKEFFSNL